MNILEMSLQASMMIAVIIIVRALAVNRLPKWGFQVLWGIVVARLLLPLRIEFHLSAYNAVPEFGRALSPVLPVNTAPVDIGLAPVMAAEPVRAAASAATPALPISPWLVVWLAGAVLSFMYFALAHLRWRRIYAKARLLSVQRAGGFHWSRHVAVKVSNRIDAPLTYGVIRPVILMPEDLLNSREFDCALAHEMIHVRHWDALKKWLLTLAACVHWFNPLAWAMYLLASRDIEMYCDESLLRGLGNGGKTRYASMLIDLEEARSAPAPLISHFGRNAIEERIRAIMRYRKASILGIALALLLVAITAVALATSAVTAAPLEMNPVAAAASPVPAAATPETNPVATADSPVLPAPTPEVLEDGWIRVPNWFSAEDIPPESYRLNDPGASDILYRYRMAPLPLDIKALAERFFGEDVGKLTLNASPDAFRKSTGRRTKGIAPGDSDIYAVSDDFAYQLYRDVDTGAVRFLKPNGILEVPGGISTGLSWTTAARRPTRVPERRWRPRWAFYGKPAAWTRGF